MAAKDHDDGEDIISDSPTSIVTRIESNLPDGPRFIAVKTSSLVHAKEPHDIIKEARLLASLSHPNIIPLIDQELSQTSLTLRMPFIPYSLDELLQSSGFSPHPIISFGKPSLSPTPREIQFVVLAKSIIFQVLCGVSYLHSELVRIAHRDIKPSNVLLTSSGRARLIDFGIAFRADEDRAERARDLWPESTARMYFEVSTGSYRAPELLFGTRTYDAFAIDAWSLGATFAEFFTSLRLETEDEEDGADFSFLRSDRTYASGSDSSSESPAPSPPLTPFVMPRGTRPRPGIPTGRWTRACLFDGLRGEIGLAWSIFKIRGTPNRVTWPSFLTLPDASKLSFVDVGAMDLGSFLPNLPPSTSSTLIDTNSHTPAPDRVPSPLDLLHRFLVYEPSRRLHPSDALGHPWFKTDPVLVLPEGVDHAEHDHDSMLMPGAVPHTCTIEGRTHTLRDLLQKHVANKGNEMH